VESLHVDSGGIHHLGGGVTGGDADLTPTGIFRNPPHARKARTTMACGKNPNGVGRIRPTEKKSVGGNACLRICTEPMTKPSKKTAKKTPAKKAPVKKAKRKPSAAFMKPVQPDDKLAQVVGAKPLPRTELTKKLWEYIRKNKLQDAKKKTLINADDALKAVFNGKKQVSMFEMTKLVSGHVK